MPGREVGQAGERLGPAFGGGESCEGVLRRASNPAFQAYDRVLVASPVVLLLPACVAVITLTATAVAACVSLVTLPVTAIAACVSLVTLPVTAVAACVALVTLPATAVAARVSLMCSVLTARSAALLSARSVVATLVSCGLCAHGERNTGEESSGEVQHSVA